ncbi:MAG: alanyl-tRNA editing protein [Gammaproteobacteria bacterium]|nr:alanyl-tRNA editing protein [Gammaproteobacteria bacterium]
MTKKLYLQDTYQFDFEGLIQEVEKDEKGIFIILDQTAFYPQGGGQPSDHGVIRSDHFEANVIHVAQHGDQIRHYIGPTEIELLAAQKVYGFVDQKRRLTNARYHTAGHLLSNIVEILNPKLKAIKGHSFPGEAYVEFQGNEAIDVGVLQNAINEAIARDDKTTIFEIDLLGFEKQFYKLPYSVPDNKKFRVMQIGNMSPIPCGGTHLSSIGEIGLIKINKIKNKNAILRVSYEVT